MSLLSTLGSGAPAPPSTHCLPGLAVASHSCSESQAQEQGKQSQPFADSGAAARPEHQPRMQDICGRPLATPPSSSILPAGGALGPEEAWPGQAGA